MVPQSQQRKPRNSSKVNLLISMTFHGLLVAAVLYFAAREGLLGKRIRKIAVEMVKEKPPEKPKEPEKPKVEPPKVEQPKVAQAPKFEPPPQVAAPPPPSGAAPPAAAPPPVDVPSFAFDGGRPVETMTDPVQIYKGLVEYAYRSRWNRPEDEQDHAFVAEVEISVDRSGRISNPVWKKSSGDKRWDASVRDVLAEVKGVSSVPPTNFPPRVLVRFDVTESESAIQ